MKWTLVNIMKSIQVNTNLMKKISKWAWMKTGGLDSILNWKAWIIWQFDVDLSNDRFRNINFTLFGIFFASGGFHREQIILIINWSSKPSVKIDIVITTEKYFNRWKIFYYLRDRGSKTYDVAANVGDFIIGEVGRIDINSGQTLEVTIQYFPFK